MASNVSIANRALLKIGGNPILSFSDESKEAQVISAVYTDIRDATLRLAQWNFATARAALAASLSEPLWGFNVLYPLPSDCLRVIELENLYATYKVEGQNILTDEVAPLNIKYIKRVTDPNQFDSLFIDTFVLFLAAEICYGFTGSSSLAGQTLIEAKAKLKEADLMQSKEDTPDPVNFSDDWIFARN